MGGAPPTVRSKTTPAPAHGIVCPPVCLYFSLHITSVLLALLTSSFFPSRLVGTSFLFLVDFAFSEFLLPQHHISYHESRNFITFQGRPNCFCCEHLIGWQPPEAHYLNPPFFGPLSSCGRWVTQNKKKSGPPGCPFGQREKAGKLLSERGRVLWLKEVMGRRQMPLMGTETWNYSSDSQKGFCHCSSSSGLEQKIWHLSLHPI